MTTTKPVTGTREWAKFSLNVVNGCPHGCLYCYAHCMAARFGRVPAGGWTEEVPRKPPTRKTYSGTVMFPTTHDLTPTNLHHTLPVLRRLLENGNRVLVVSKPHLEVITKICEDLDEYRSQVLFRFSIGSAREKTLAFFEPGAPTFEERLTCLKYAHTMGWRCSVSMEPLLEPDEDRVVELVELLADAGAEEVWIGKLNRARINMGQNGTWNERSAAAVKVIHESQTDARILSLGRRLDSNTAVRWKESFKAVLGVELKTDASEGEAWAG
jgi:DNA repair photolyase